MYQNVSEWSRAESSATVAPDFTMSVVQQSVVKSVVKLSEMECSRLYIAELGNSGARFVLKV